MPLPRKERRRRRQYAPYRSTCQPCRSPCRLHCTSGTAGCTAASCFTPGDRPRRLPTALEPSGFPSPLVPCLHNAGLPPGCCLPAGSRPAGPTPRPRPGRAHQRAAELQHRANLHALQRPDLTLGHCLRLSGGGRPRRHRRHPRHRGGRHAAAGDGAVHHPAAHQGAQWSGQGRAGLGQAEEMESWRARGARQRRRHPFCLCRWQPPAAALPCTLGFPQQQCK